jgi:CheY-like chemotaxis protein
MARITVVNDSEEFLAVMQDVFDTLGHTPTVLNAEQVSVDAVASSRPDLLVVDLRLGSASVLDDGWALVVGARAHPDLAEVPVIVCSGDVLFLRERAEEIAALADVHALEKPFGVSEVEELVRKLLDRRETRSA